MSQLNSTTTTTTATTTHILHRNLNETPHHAIASSGITIHLTNSRSIIDATGGASVAILGHTQPTVIAAVAAQMAAISYVYSGAGYTSNAAEDLASLILAESPGSLDRAIFVSSGSEAMEAALKVARQYHCERGDLARTSFISRKNSYHGNTLGALSVSGFTARRVIYEDMLMHNVGFADAVYEYRGKGEGESDAAYLARLRKGVEDEFVRIGTGKVAAFVAETVSGATLGCATAVPGYFQAVREVCDKYGALLILDEVMCGMGKTGTMHAWEQEGITGPDIQTVAKALGGGFAPIAGVLLSKKVVSALENGTGVLLHGHTYQAHPTACAAAAEVQRIIKRENLLANVVTQGALLSSLLKSKVLPSPIVGDVRGRGLFWGIEFIKDKATKTPFPRKLNVAARVAARGMKMGLGLLPTNGAGDVWDMDMIIVSPPYIVTEKEVRQIVDLLVEVIESIQTELV